MWSFPVSNVCFAQDVNLNVKCVACCWQVCSRTCLAGHRDRFSCHNTTCLYHCPMPLHRQPASDIAFDDESGSATDNKSTAAAAASIEPIPNANSSTTPVTSDNDAVDKAEKTRIFPNDSLVFRETITREWYIVNGQVVAPIHAQPPSLPGPSSAISYTEAATENEKISKSAAPP